MFKWIAGIALSFLVAQNAFGLDIVSGQYDVDREVLQLEVEYTGGCYEHDFSLEISEFCLQGWPVVCDAVLVDHTEEDSCKMLVRETVEFEMDRDDSLVLGFRLAGDDYLSIQLGQPSSLGGIKPHESAQ